MCLIKTHRFPKRAIEHNLDKNNGTMTIREFINLTRNAYGGDIIKQLEETYK